MGLKEYQKKRGFDKTSEPKGQKQATNSEKKVFVVHKHQASNLHWDFRLEHEGVLASWAVPKGPPEKIGEKRLAVQVEDHPFDYKDFSGNIPEGQYGAGHVEIWDSGTYEPVKWDEKVVEVILNGKKMTGRYSLIKTHGYGKNSWILVRQAPKVK
jgi:bifunctional non-homologous end joining protein LigD